MLFLLVFLIATAVIDFRCRKFRNWMFLTGLLGGLLLPIFGLISLNRDMSSLVLGVAVALLLMLPAYIKGWMGAGDVKFFVVLSVWLGFSPALMASFLGGSVLALAHSLVYLVAVWLQRNNNFSMAFSAGYLNQSINQFISKNTKKKSIPYAGYMAIACMTWLLLNHKG
ncbi:MAG: prepilin peptidase [Comamonas sp.]|nr:prepilin peptidase [Comamonas sp.]